MANQGACKSCVTEEHKRLKKCDDIRGRLTLYLDHELQGVERASVEAHLTECESCAAILARELNFINAVRESGPLYIASPDTAREDSAAV